ncbi:MAG TPA: hypothetical protein VEC38_00495 [Candidatus Binataceae bacterium]|nr:hypothetical protein [Candidatus Binataceae bacterium]
MTGLTSGFGRSAIAIVAMAAVAVAILSAPARAISIPAPIVFVGTDNNIYYCPVNCDRPRCITCPPEKMQAQGSAGVREAAFSLTADEPEAVGYGWPAFSPDGGRIAYSSTAYSKSGESFGAWVYDVSKAQSTEIFESKTERAIYFFWLPDRQHLSFLLTERDGLSLMLAEVRENAPIRIVTTGMPLYFDWRDGPGTVAIHTAVRDAEQTEQVSLLNLTPTSQQVAKVLSRGHTPFKTPCWSPDGKRLAYIANYAAESNLVVADPDAQHPRSIVSLPVGENSFEWSPDSRHIAYATSILPREPVYRGIKLVDVADATTRRVTKDDVAAYFFSPDSRYLAYIELPPDKPVQIWKLADLKTGQIKELTSFLATPEESIEYRYFDQFALSHAVWSPDSKAFVYAGLRVLQLPDRPLPSVPPPSVWVVPVDGSQPHQLGNGTLAFFSPAAAKK